jgi:hypothetical protein
MAWPDPQVELEAAELQFVEALRQLQKARQGLRDAKAAVLEACQRRDAAMERLEWPRKTGAAAANESPPPARNPGKGE